MATRRTIDWVRRIGTANEQHDLSQHDVGAEAGAVGGEDAGVDADVSVLGWCAIREGTSPVLAPDTTRLSPELQTPFVLSSGQCL